MSGERVKFTSKDAQTFAMVWGRAAVRRKEQKGSDNRARMMWLRGVKALNDARKLREMGF